MLNSFFKLSQKKCPVNEASYLQKYLNDFCLKNNRRYLGEKVDRLIIAAVSYVWYKLLVKFTICI